ncbi:hypothetical protein [Helicobacter sp. 13S00477-4]|uniref:hypothetical protein n=1 Tax=Helicobacter sp. 13S00477-4 TaxID=1905759 RepID=UPI000BA5191A|nr:hypothetical protein [Helicobacter sp. 13S00477-4]PAF52447.1 hypothetical protein BKH44_02685 [Helicobacter sp. 13S00477-4]
MSEAQTPKDLWQTKLDEKLQSLKACQNEKNLQGCFTCKDILECQIRKDYVKAVYESMSKGQSGDFEF